MIFSRSLFIVVLALAGAACSLTPTSYSRLSGLDRDDYCRTLLSEMQQRIDQQGSRQALGHRIHSYPYLRSNRFLASFNSKSLTDKQKEQWYRQLFDLGSRARRIELNNLSRQFSLFDQQQIEVCIEALARQDRTAQDFFLWLDDEVKVPDNYLYGMRVLGLFPLTRIPVLRALKIEQAEVKQNFNQYQMDAAPSVIYRPPARPRLSRKEVSLILRDGAQSNALNIPVVSAPQLDTLFKNFAPAWKVFTNDRADRVGQIVSSQNAVMVDTSNPVSYQYPSYTRFYGELLLQLNYMIWFPARSAESSWDLHAGKLDGLIWRVTLNTDGSVLAYDSIHSCGCYHKLYPVSARTKDAYGEDLGEWDEELPLILTEGMPEHPVNRILIQVQAANHYIIGVSRFKQQTEAVEYQMLPYLQLTQLKDRNRPGRSSSLFDAKGLVPDSARPERYLLWPMGVEAAGSMRLWGNHAVSLTGVRHFDDPQILELFFNHN
ncbi:hypothetical protein [Motiliproteus sp. MSK22-1]|uniref:hypothetical protein n=1 Tax=Motiliproteus sp. MSK22-1 TaxID=1897630 RepID=UPI0009767F12|nr:hypothetical protein [Motiliproteus sp. MSK22-1]OMH29473.1 hypothetical protein BGP75_19715 [Motiliproteus sp. MSK22-1]